MAFDSFECKIITGGINHCDYNWNKTSDEIDRCFKIYLPMSGKAQIQMDDGEINIKPGYIYFISGFNIQAQKCLIPLDIYWIHFIPSSLYLRHLLLNTEAFFIWKISEFSFIQEFKSSVENVFKGKDYKKPHTLLNSYSFEEAKIHSHLLQIIAEILKKSAHPGFEKTREMKRMEPSIIFMNNEFKNNPSLQIIASKSTLAPNYFHRIFKKHFGVTPFIYMQRLRMEIAIRLLTTTSKSIKEVAFEAGYENEFYFYRQFKKYCGYSPGKLKTLGPF